MSMHSFLPSFPLSTQSYTLCILFVLTPHHLPENEPIFTIVVISPKRTQLSELWRRSTIRTLL